GGPTTSAPAIQQLPPGWQVLHCGVARGVLYVTYVERGQAAITPAVASAAVAKACADAGWPIPSGAAQRGGLAPAPPAAAPSAPSRRATVSPANRSQPSFTPQALGTSLSIEARNESDIAWRCTINFGWTSDEHGSVPRSATAQVTLAPRQNNRVADLSGAGRNLRFVGAPSWFCMPNE
ncbi:MAG TPA: hypothetical protein VEZ89_12200, partial [Rubrivivax sp.]|nr:hypothetical protein [Rubrivivax sp.]